MCRTARSCAAVPAVRTGGSPSAAAGALGLEELIVRSSLNGDYETRRRKPNSRYAYADTGRPSCCAGRNAQPRAALSAADSNPGALVTSLAALTPPSGSTTTSTTATASATANGG